MKKVLIIKLSALGDIIFTIPLANVLKNSGHEVHWLVTEKGYSIIKDNPCVDKTILLPLYTWRKNKFSLKPLIECFKIICNLRKEKYDISLDCQRRVKSLLFSMFCGAKRRIITRQGAKEFSHLGANEYADYMDDMPPHMVYRNLSYARHLGLDLGDIKFTLPPSSEETKQKVDWLLKGLDKNKPTVAIAPETTWDTKHWEKSHWDTVVNAIKDDYNLVYTGGNPDFFDHLNDVNFINLAGKTSLDDLIEIYSRIALVISPDSGSAHLAWATQKPAVISLFMSTPPKTFGCFGDESKYFAIRGEIDCPACFKRSCPKAENNKICTKYPLPEEVIAIAKKFINADFLI